MKNKIMMMLAAMLTTISAFAAGPVALISIDGMECEDCAHTVQENLSHLPQVAKVEVTLKKSQARLTMNEGAKIDEAAIRKAVSKAGYDVKSVQSI